MKVCPICGTDKFISKPQEQILCLNGHLTKPINKYFKKSGGGMTKEELQTIRKQAEAFRDMEELKDGIIIRDCETELELCDALEQTQEGMLRLLDNNADLLQQLKQAQAEIASFNAYKETAEEIYRAYINKCNECHKLRKELGYEDI